MHYGPVMIDLEGTELTTQESALLKHPALGGVVLLTRNLHDKASLIALTQAIRSQARNAVLIFIQNEEQRWLFEDSAALKATETPQSPFAIDDRTLDTLTKDFPQFKKLSASLEAIVPANIIYSTIDTVPPAYSKHWLQEILRKQLNYQGAIISNNLFRIGLAVGDLVIKARMALDAGCDMVTLCHPDRKLTEKVLDRLERTLSKDSQQRLNYLAGKQYNQLNRNSPTSIAMISQDPSLLHMGRPDRWLLARSKE